MGFNKIEKEWTTGSGYEAKCLFVNDSHRCGYVRVPADHILFGKGYNDNVPNLASALPSSATECYGCGGKRWTAESAINVHGGVTFAGHLDDDGWWFGFDCAHAGDLCKYDLERSPRRGGVFRSTEFVVSECESLASQLAEIQKSAGVVQP